MRGRGRGFSGGLGLLSSGSLEEECFGERGDACGEAG